MSREVGYTDCDAKESCELWLIGSKERLRRKNLLN